MRITRTEDCWLVVSRNKKWLDRVGFRAFTTEKAAQKNLVAVELAPNTLYAEVVCVPVTFTVMEVNK